MRPALVLRLRHEDSPQPIEFVVQPRQFRRIREEGDEE